MRTSPALRVAACVLVGLCVAVVARGAESPALRMPKVFTDNMVLQQEMPVAVWGWAQPGEAVTVSFNGQSAKATPGGDGKWRATLDAMKADGKAQTLTVSTGSGTVALKNVVLGEVWLCAGQSNMNREVEVKDADPGMRLFWTHASTTPMKDDFGDTVIGWAPAIPEQVAAISKIRTERFDRGWKQGFAEVGYVFGRRIRKALGVPVGLVKMAYGGSVAKAWTPRDDIEKEFPFGVAVKGAQSGVLYQAMVNGLAPMTVRGVLWYQGETDGRNWNYDQDLEAMIEGWRKRFENPTMPFYLAQIAQTTYASGMQRVWECQGRVAANVPNVTLAPSNDLWDGGRKSPDAIRVDAGNSRSPATGWPIAGSSNPHPPNKRIVSLRLAEQALVKTYGKDLGHEALAPIYESHQVKDGKLLVKFANVGKGLKTDDGKEPNWFEVAPAGAGDVKLAYVKAQAKIVGKDTVAVWSPEVKDPKYVRLGWHVMARHNLYNSSGLPAINFRTDTRKTKAR